MSRSAKGVPLHVRAFRAALPIVRQFPVTRYDDDSVDQIQIRTFEQKLVANALDTGNYKRLSCFRSIITLTRLIGRSRLACTRRSSTRVETALDGGSSAFFLVQRRYDDGQHGRLQGTEGGSAPSGFCLAGGRKSRNQRSAGQRVVQCAFHDDSST